MCIRDRNYVEQTLSGIDEFTDGLSAFVYVFSPTINDTDATEGGWVNLSTDVGYDPDGADDFKDLFGNNGMESPFQDGSYAYLIIPGSGSGTSAQAPVLVVIDTENPSKLHKTLVP